MRRSAHAWPVRMLRSAGAQPLGAHVDDGLELLWVGLFHEALHVVELRGGEAVVGRGRRSRAPRAALFHELLHEAHDVLLDVVLLVFVGRLLLVHHAVQLARAGLLPTAEVVAERVWGYKTS